MSNTVFKLVAKLGIDTTSFENGLKGAKNEAGGFGSAVGNGLKTVAKVGTAALATATTAIGAFGVTSVKTGQEFDKSMSQVAATMGLSMDEMAEKVGSVDTAFGTFSGNLREYAQFMGSNTAFSATQAADALNYMALAGYDAQTSMNMLPNVLNLAAAGNMELARASDMVTDTQTAFGLSLERTSQMVDEMAKASSTGNTSVEQLGDAFLTVGGLAQELNGGMIMLEDGTTKSVDGVQELEIALTAMANAGIKGSEAGTHMRNMLLKLSSPTDAGAKAFEKLGIEVFDAEGNMKSLGTIFESLDGAMAELTQEEKLQAISDIFNTRDTAAAEALMNAIGNDWASIGESILDSSGAAQKMADTQLDNLAGDVTLFKSALEGAQIAVSDGLTPSLRDFVKFGTDGLSRITTAFTEGGIEGAMAELGNVLSDGVAMITSKAPELIKSGAALIKALATGLISNAPQIATVAFDLIKEFGGSIVSALPQLATEASNMMKNFGEYAKNAIPEFLPTALTAIMEFSGTLRENAGMLVDSGLDMIKSIADGLIQALPSMIETIPTIVTNIAGIINDNAPKLIATGIELIGKLVAGIIQAMPTIIAEFPKIVQAIFAVITAVNWIHLGGKIITGIGNGIKGLASDLPSKIKDIVGTIDKFLKNFDWKGLGKFLITGILNGVKALATAIPNALKTIITTGINFIKTTNWLELGVNIVAGIANGLASAAHLVLDAITGIVKGAWDAVTDFFDIHSPSRKMFWAGEMVDKGFANGIKGNMGYVDKAFDELNDLTIATASVKTDTSTANNNSKIVSLLEKIANSDKNVTIKLEGDADRLFRVMQSKARHNEELTGTPALV